MSDATFCKWRSKRVSEAKRLKSFEEENGFTLRDALAYTATLSGLSMMPGGIAMLLLMPVSGFAAGIVQPKYLIMIGMSVVTVALGQMTSLTPDASFHFFAFARVFLFV